MTVLEGQHLYIDPVLDAWLNFEGSFRRRGMVKRNGFHLHVYKQTVFTEVKVSPYYLNPY